MNLLTRIQKPCCVLLLLLGYVSILHAQSPAAVQTSGQVKVKVTDLKTKLPLEFASAALARPKDSTFVSGGLTGKEGIYLFQNIPAATYLLKISFVGYKSAWRTVKVEEGKLADAGTITLEEGILLNDVILKGEPVAITVKKDTTDYNTAAFKAPPDAMVEDGLKKMGMDVDASGTIKHNGQVVEKLTVDGKEFFGGDPKIATKNLPYDAIAKVQVIDDKTEQAKVTGIDDGKRVKTLNLVLKDDSKKGWFGNGSVAGGTSSRYLGSVSLNHFTNDKQINFLGLSNNVNQVSFTSEDANNFGASGVSSGGSRAGLTLTNSGGINYVDAWGKKNNIRFSSNLFAATTNGRIENETATQETQLLGTFFNNNRTNNKGLNQNYRLGPRVSWEKDSLTSFSLLSNNNITFNDTKNSSILSQSDSVRSLINDESKLAGGHTIKPQSSGSLSMSRRFHNHTGSISTYTYWLFSPSSSDNTTVSDNNFYKGGRPSIFINRVEQNDLMARSFNTNITINRTIGKKREMSLFAAPAIVISANTRDRNTLEYNPANGHYEIRLDSLSNDSRNTTTTAGGSFGFSKSTKTTNIYINTTVNNLNISGNIHSDKYFEGVSKNYLTVLPNLSFSWYPRNSKRMSFDISGSNRAPTINDLFLKQNNSSVLIIHEGNPDLRLTTSLSANFNYSTSNAVKKTYFNYNMSYSKTLNSVSSFSFFDKETGITRTKPININGNYSAYFSGNFVVPTKVTALRITPGFSGSNSRNYTFINGLKNQSDSYDGGVNVSVSYSYKESFFLSLGNRTGYSTVKNTIQTGLKNHFISVDNNASINFEPVKKWRLTADASHRYFSGRDVVLINAGLQRYFMPKNKLMFELKGYDLLKTNSDVSHYISETQIIDTRTNNLQQYFYMKLTYKVNKVGKK